MTLRMTRTEKKSRLRCQTQADATVPMKSEAMSRPPWVKKSATVRKSVYMR